MKSVESVEPDRVVRKENMMRIIEKVTDIEYEDTKQFFKKRAEKFRADNPYSVTMYQDNNKELVKERNEREVEKLYPLLNLSADSTVLDVACGIGRWADAIKDEIKKYSGFDFSGELIQIANKRNTRENFCFYEGNVNDIEKILLQKNEGRYNTVLMIGILMYLNDDDIVDVLGQIVRQCEKHAIVCIREPLGIKDRLTLKNFFSEELQDNYNAIYRTREELVHFFVTPFFNNGFTIKEEGFLFDEDSLNNRKETAQYYYILER